MLTKIELQNLLALCEAGARAESATRPLVESAQVQAIAVELLKKVSQLEVEPEKE